MSTDCIFCQISEDRSSARKIYEGDDIVAFYDINPQAPVHVLIVSKKHMKNLLDVEQKDELLVGRMLMVATQIAKQLHIAENGYRIVINTNRNAGQSVDHLHFHLLGGRAMHWPPG